MARFTTLTIAALMALAISVQAFPVDPNRPSDVVLAAPGTHPENPGVLVLRSLSDRGASAEPVDSEDAEGGKKPVAVAPAAPADSEDAEGDKKPVAVAPAAPVDSEDAEGGKKPVAVAPAAPADSEDAEGDKKPVAVAPAAPVDSEDAEGDKKPVAVAPAAPADPEDVGDSEKPNGSSASGTEGTGEGDNASAPEPED